MERWVADNGQWGSIHCRRGGGVATWRSVLEIISRFQVYHLIFWAKSLPELFLFYRPRQIRTERKQPPPPWKKGREKWKQVVLLLREDCRRKTNTFFPFENVFFITSCVQLPSTAITLLWPMIVLSLFNADLDDTCQSSIKLTPRLAWELTQPSRNGTTLAYENHYHIFLRPIARVEIFFISHFLHDSKRVWPK